MTLNDINCDSLTYKSFVHLFDIFKAESTQADSHSIGIEKLKGAYVDYIWGAVNIFSAIWYQAVFTWRGQLDEINDAWALKMWHPHVERRIFQSATPDMNKGNFFCLWRFHRDYSAMFETDHIVTVGNAKTSDKMKQ